MANVTTWEARRLGDRILCGRQVPPGGPYACMGEIGTVMSDAPGHEQIRLRPGITLESRPGEEPRYRETARSRFRGGRLNPVDEASGATYERRRGNSLAYPALTVPVTAPCTHGAHVNRVTGASIRVL